MFVIKSMRLNKFVARPIVTNRQLFATKGECAATIISKDTADCYNQPTAEGASKTKVLGLAVEISAAAYKHHTELSAETLDKNAKDN